MVISIPLIPLRISFNILTEIQGTGRYGKFLDRNRRKNIFLTGVTLVTAFGAIGVAGYMIY